MNWRVLVLGLITATTGCSAEPVPATEADAIAMGLDAVECEQFDDIVVFAATDSVFGVTDPPNEAALCDAFQTALNLAVDDGIVTNHMLGADSIASGVVQPMTWARSISGEHLTSRGFSVRLDLKTRSQNLLVSWQDDGDLLEIGWVPEGLRY
jgi:hypothetical protein